jgi:protein gp37
MAQKSNIEWTEATWNIARGCTKVNEDCKYCYMYRDSMQGTRYNPKAVTRTKTVFNMPLRLKTPSLIFTSSLTDFFHPEVDSYRAEAWDIIRRCPQHTFQILTKRPDRILYNLPGNWDRGYPNVWLGASIGSQSSIDMGNQLLSVPATKHFLSIEPMWSEVDLHAEHLLRRAGTFSSARYLDWVIVGGESGNDNGKYRYRPCKLEWIENIITQCKETNTPVFVKQLGTHLSKELGLKDRHGKNMEEWPAHLRIREFPEI